MNYYEHFLGDYNKKTTKLRLVHHGAYRVLLDTYYAEEKPLPGPYAELYTICRAIDKNEKEAVRKVADDFFPVALDGLRHNERADEEISRAQKRINASRQNGKGGGRKPSGNPAANPAGIPEETQQPSQQGTQQHTQPGEALLHAPSPIPQSGKAKPTRSRASPVALPDWLPLDAWQQWAKHRGSKLTPQAIALQLGKLDALRKLGHSPADLIAAAIESSWATFYPPRGVAQQGRHDARAKVAGDIWKGNDDARRDDDDRIIDGEAKRVA